MEQNNQTSSRHTKKIVMSIAIFIIILVAGMGIGMTVMGDNASFFVSIVGDDETDYTLPLDEFLVNITSDTSSRPAIVRMDVAISSQHNEAPYIIETNMAKIRDAIIYVITNQTTETLLDSDDGVFILKQKMTSRINDVLDQSDQNIIDDVYITNILIQK